MFLACNDAAFGVGWDIGPDADAAAKARRRQFEAEIAAGLLYLHVPALQPDFAVAHIGLAQHFVHRIAQVYRFLFQPALAVGGRELIGGVGTDVVLVLRGFVRPAFDAVGERTSGIRRYFRAEQIQGRAEPEIEIALQQRQIDHALSPQRLHLVGAELFHHLEGAFDHAADAGFADEHVVRFLREHEAAGTRQRIEARFGQTLQLELAVAVGEIGEAEKRQPVRDRLVEGAENARLVRVARVAREQLFRFLAPVAAEMRVQQIHHGPQVAAFLHVHLEQVAQVVERRAGVAEQVLLFDRGGLGVALGHDQAAELGAELARHLLPYRLTDAVAKADAPVGDRVGQKDAPAIVRHFHRAVAGPALRIHAGGGAQIDVGGGEVIRPHLAPPVEKVRLPVFERALQRLVAGKIDVVGYLFAVID